MSWFRVTAERFDWMPRRGVMICYPQGYVGFGTRACVACGIKLGVIERIRKPAGYAVGKDGKVTRDG